MHHGDTESTKRNIFRLRVLVLAAVKTDLDFESLDGLARKKLVQIEFLLDQPLLEKIAVQRL
jgi:hypothetical protein